MAQAFRFPPVARSLCALPGASLASLGVGALLVAGASAGRYSPSGVMAPNVGLALLVGLVLGLVMLVLPSLGTSLLRSLGLAVALTLAVALSWFMATSWAGSELASLTPLVTLVSAWTSSAGVLLFHLVRSTLVLGLTGLASLGVLAIG